MPCPAFAVALKLQNLFQEADTLLVTVVKLHQDTKWRLSKYFNHVADFLLILQVTLIGINDLVGR